MQGCTHFAISGLAAERNSIPAVANLEAGRLNLQQQTHSGRLNLRETHSGTQGKAVDESGCTNGGESPKLCQRGKLASGEAAFHQVALHCTHCL